jgi:hypothetical protein
MQLRPIKESWNSHFACTNGSSCIRNHGIDGCAGVKDVPSGTECIQSITAGGIAHDIRSAIHEFGVSRLTLQAEMAQ